LGSDRDRGPIGHQHQQGSRRAERLARDAVVARPAAVLVLDLVEVGGDGLVPLGPFVAALDQQRFADVHVAEELFPAVVAEALNEGLVGKLIDHGLLGGGLSLLGFLAVLDHRFGTVLVGLGSRRAVNDFLGLLFLHLAGVDRILAGAEVGGGGIKRD